MLFKNEILFYDGNEARRLKVGKKNDIRIKDCIFIVPEEEIFYKIISLSSGDDIKKAIQDATFALPFRKEDTISEYFEITPIEQNFGHRDLAFFAASKSYLENCIKTIEAAGLKIQDFIPETIGLVKAIFHNFETRDAVLIIAVSYERTVFVVFAGRAIHFSGTLPFGSRALESENEESDRLIGTILDSISYYENRARHEHGASHVINRIILIGDVADNILERIALNTQLRVETSEILKRVGAEFAPLIGSLA